MATTLVARNLAVALGAIVVLVLSMSGGALAEPGFSFDATPGKLPKTVVPVHYAIELSPILIASRLPALKSWTSRCASPPRDLS